MTFTNSASLFMDGDSANSSPSLAGAADGFARVGGQNAANSRLSSSMPVFEGVVRMTDVVLLLLAVAVAGMVHPPFSPHAPFSSAMRHEDVLTALIGICVSGYGLARGGSYDVATLRSGWAQAQIIGASLALGIAASYLASRLIPPVDAIGDRSWSLVWPVIACAGLAASRATTGRVLRSWARRGWLARTVAIVGSSELAGTFLSRIAASVDLRVIGIYDGGTDRHGTDRHGTNRHGPDGAAMPSVEDLLARCRREPVDLIVIALPLAEVDRIAALQRVLRPAVADLYLATDLVGYSRGTAQVAAIAGGPAILVQAGSLKHWDALQKRVFDVVLAALLLVLLMPAMLLIALVIRLDSPGPVLFRQPRVGFNNNLFEMYKFRSMFHHMADLLADRQTTQGDDRITRSGKWLRKFSLDELPQLLNVLRGEMSLVGPRPHAPNTKADGQRFTEIVADYAVRHRVKPGITGWAQVNGWRGETRTREQIENRVAYDLRYIENWSLRFDIKILLLTVLREIASRNAF